MANPKQHLYHVTPPTPILPRPFGWRWYANAAPQENIISTVQTVSKKGKRYYDGRDSLSAARSHDSVSSHLHFAQTLRSQCAAALARSDTLLGHSNKGVVSWRQLRAQVASKEREVTQLRQKFEARSERLRQRKCNQCARLIAVTVQTRPPRDDLIRSIMTVNIRRAAVERIDKLSEDLGKRILHARRVLVREAIGIFGVHQDSLRMWQIAGLRLPCPEKMKSELRIPNQSLISASPVVDINAAMVHLIQLVNLLTRYLSITLPFTPWFPGIAHVVRPVLRANQPFLNTTRHRDKAVLWMSSTISKRDSKSTQKHRQFLTAFALFAHSVAYLAWSQGVDGICVESEQSVSAVRVSATSVLQLLSELCQSPRLGQRAHEPGTTLLAHLGFSLDVNHVVDAVLRHEEDAEQGWDLVDASTA